MKIGDPVTVWLSEEHPAVIARVTQVYEDGFGFYARPARRLTEFHYMKRDEGIMWVKGHDGKHVDAFRTSRALLDSLDTA